MRAASERPAVTHWWACANRKIAETVKTDATGQAVITAVCLGCGGTDEPGGSPVDPHQPAAAVAGAPNRAAPTNGAAS